MPGLQLLPFLSQDKPNKMVKLAPPRHTQTTLCYLHVLFHNCIIRFILQVWATLLQLSSKEMMHHGVFFMFLTENFLKYGATPKLTVLIKIC